MNPLIQLPRTARIVTISVEDLEIENHMVVSHQRMLLWMMHVMNRDLWDDVLSQLISQGFTTDAVMQTCETELNDSLVFRYLMDQLGVQVSEHSTAGKNIKIEITRKFQNIKTWNQLHDAMHRDAGFRKKIVEKYGRN